MQNYKHVTVCTFYIYLDSTFYECSLFLSVNFIYYVVSIHFNLLATNSLSFCCARNVYSFVFWRIGFCWYRIPGWQSSNFYTLRCHPVIFWHPCLFLYIIWYILAAFLSFCLPLNFVSLTMMHLGIKLFRFILLRVHEI